MYGTVRFCGAVVAHDSLRSMLKIWIGRCLRKSLVAKRKLFLQHDFSLTFERQQAMDSIPTIGPKKHVINWK